MPYPLEITTALSAEATADALEDMSVRVAAEVIGLAEVLPPDTATFDALRERLGRRTVGISDWAHPIQGLRVNGGQWDRGEVETNLRQVEVIVLALRTSLLRRSSSVRVNPTQQGGFDAQGVLAEGPWVLEAFGGVNVNNNDKLAEDGDALCSAPEGPRRIFACRPSAWPWRSSVKNVRAGRFTLVNDPEHEGVRLFEFQPLPVAGQH